MDSCINHNNSIDFHCHTCHKKWKGNEKIQEKTKWGLFLFCNTNCQDKFFINEEPDGSAMILDSTKDPPQYVHVAPINLNDFILGKEDVGRATWVFLQSSFCSIADNNPGDLSTSIKEDLKGQVDFISNHYPCLLCRNHWKDMVTKKPIDLSSGVAAANWLAERHNDVNARLGKPIWSISSTQSMIKAYLCHENTV